MSPAPCGSPRWPPFRGRPPWWPEGEPWPPAEGAGPRAWRRLRHHFFRRAVIFFAAVVVLATALSTLALWGVASLLGLLRVPPGLGGGGQAALVVFVTLLSVGTVVAARGLRRMAAPVGDVMAALGRVADGEYATRVRERGPQEVSALTQAFNAMAERLQRQDEQRRGLLMDISHELRTPLAVLQGTLEGMLDGVYPRDDARLSSILEETQVLARVIEDLRTLTLAEGLELKLTRTPTDLADLAQDAIASFQAQADAAGVTLRLEAAPGAPMVDIDPERIRQVLNNLLSNALRYTPRGGTVRVRFALGDPAWAVVSVEDSGAGIRPEELPHIFDRFYKSADSRGSGLGLPIARSLVRAHGGEISAQSVLGQGTTVRVTLPLAASP